jgi:cytochrome P450
VRRSALNPFFSRKQVLALEEIVQNKADKLTALAHQKFSAAQELDLHHAFRAISVDVITEYAFAQCYDLLDREDIGREFFEMIQGVGPTIWVFQQWPGLQKVALSMPTALAKALSKPIGLVLTLTEVCALYS